MTQTFLSLIKFIANIHLLLFIRWILISTCIISLSSVSTSCFYGQTPTCATATASTPPASLCSKYSLLLFQYLSKIFHLSRSGVKITPTSADAPLYMLSTPCAHSNCTCMVSYAGLGSSCYYRYGSLLCFLIFGYYLLVSYVGFIISANQHIEQQ